MLCSIRIKPTEPSTAAEGDTVWEKLLVGRSLEQIQTPEGIDDELFPSGLCEVGAILKR